ncbi:MAG: hypothetical protein KF689_01100 [Gemmatimonadaceae bacterium]|nr:hypothetical protein [Gemmatimonadaceae bacterium]MCW5826527.1 hypothetical protein [Gemmatimonadaceae bacterium]
MTSPDALHLIRRGILAVLAFGCVGLIAELLLLEHYAELAQLPPLVLLSLTLVTILWHWLDKGPKSLRALQVVALLLVMAGAVGMYLHFGSNMEFERELEPDLVGMPFWINVIRGATPTLAPGTLVQFGLLGLLYAYRHPARTAPGA